jgi:hypothetical protein
MGDVIDLFRGLFLDLRTAVILYRAGRIGTTVFFVVDAIAVPVRDGAAVVTCETGFIGAFVFFVVDAVAVPVRDGTAILAGQAWLVPAGVVVIIYAVVVRIGYRAAMPFGRSGFEGTGVLVIRNAIHIRILLFGRRGDAGGRKPDANGCPYHLVMEAAFVRSMIEITEAPAEVGAEHDIAEFEACPAVDPYIHGFKGIGSFPYRNRIGAIRILRGGIIDECKGFVGGLAAIKEAYLGACAQKKAVFMTTGQVEFISYVQGNIDVIEMEALMGINSVREMAVGGIVVPGVFSSLGGIRDCRLEKEPLISQRNFHDDSQLKSRKRGLELLHRAIPIWYIVLFQYVRGMQATDDPKSYLCLGLVQAAGAECHCQQERDFSICSKSFGAGVEHSLWVIQAITFRTGGLFLFPTP